MLLYQFSASCFRSSWSVHNFTNTNLQQYLQYLSQTKKNINEYKHKINIILLIINNIIPNEED